MLVLGVRLPRQSAATGFAEQAIRAIQTPLERLRARPKPAHMRRWLLTPQPIRRLNGQRKTPNGGDTSASIKLPLLRFKIGTVLENLCERITDDITGIAADIDGDHLLKTNVRYFKRGELA